MKKLAFLLLPAALLGGCIKFGAEPPPSLLTLEPAVQVPVGETERSTGAPTITVGVPAVPQELAVQRVPVHATGTSIAYVKDAQWVDSPARLFARLLADTLTASTDYVVLGARQTQVDPGAQLSGELRNFGVEAATNEAVVTFDAVLIRGGEPAVEKRRFEARVPLGKVEAGEVGRALNGAANQVARDVAAWVAGSAS